MNTLEVFYWARNGTFLCQFKSKSWTHSFLESILRLSLKFGKLTEHHKQTKIENLNILIILLLSPKGYLHIIWDPRTRAGYFWSQL